MSRIYQLRITKIWFLLVAATCLSWEGVRQLGLAIDYRFVTTAVMAIAFIKTRFIMLDFMELRGATWPLRAFAEGWAVVVCIAVMTIYWDGGR